MITNVRSRWNHRDEGEGPNLEPHTLGRQPRNRSARAAETLAKQIPERARRSSLPPIRQSPSPHSPRGDALAKSVAMEYYRLNIADCGVSALWLNKRRISRQICPMCDLRRAGDRPMQSRHDCESQFGSTNESGRQRRRAARPPLGATAAAREAPDFCAPATAAAAAGSQPTAPPGCSSAPRAQPTSTTTKTQPAARTGHERRTSGGRSPRSRIALGPAARPHSQAIRLARPTPAESDPQGIV